MTTHQQAAGATPAIDIRRVAIELYTPPFRHEHGYIRDANDQVIADDGALGEMKGLIAARIRGWGRIQYMDNPEGRAAKLQDAVGEIVADALNAWWGTDSGAAPADSRITPEMYQARINTLLNMLERQDRNIERAQRLGLDGVTDRPGFPADPLFHDAGDYTPDKPVLDHLRVMEFARECYDAGRSAPAAPDTVPAAYPSDYDTLKLFNDLQDLCAEANAVDTVIGRPAVLQQKLIKMRDTVGQMTQTYLPHPADRAARQPIAPAPLTWAVDRWKAEVQNRPLLNVHRRTLDDVWRQVIRFHGGDPEQLVGPSHDDLIDGIGQERSAS